MRGGFRCAALIVAVTVSAPRAWGQTSGTVQATARVLSAITFTGTNLAFGRVAPTQTKVVAPATGGTFRITLQRNTPATLTWTLPATLGPNVGIGTYRARRAYVNNSALGVATSPTTGATAAINSPSGSVFLWIGATLTTTGAAPGSYSAPIVVSLVYN
jgi:hypothetical protein